MSRDGLQVRHPVENSPTPSAGLTHSHVSYLFLSSRLLIFLRSFHGILILGYKVPFQPRSDAVCRIPSCHHLLLLSQCIHTSKDFYAH